MDELQSTFYEAADSCGKEQVVLLEYDPNFPEWVATTGYHYRGQFIERHQVKSDDPYRAMNELMAKIREAKGGPAMSDEMIDIRTCIKCQHCGEWTNFASSDHYQAVLKGRQEAEQRCPKHGVRLADAPVDDAYCPVCERERRKQAEQRGERAEKENATYREVVSRYSGLLGEETEKWIESERERELTAEERNRLRCAADVVLSMLRSGHVSEWTDYDSGRAEAELENALAFARPAGGEAIPHKSPHLEREYALRRVVERFLAVLESKAGQETLGGWNWTQLRDDAREALRGGGHGGVEKIRAYPNCRHCKGTGIISVNACTGICGYCNPDKET